MFSAYNLFESRPENPDTVVIKNSYYPRGLTEDSIYNYYMSVKDLLLDQVKNRELMFFLMSDVNKPIVVRRMQGSFIELTERNYEELITTGRTVSIHSTMKNKENFGIVDIDHDDFNKCNCTVNFP